jgi:Lipase (class 3)
LIPDRNIPAVLAQLSGDIYGSGLSLGDSQCAYLFEQLDDNLCACVFQGSNDIADWWSNLDRDQCDPALSGHHFFPGRVHRGFWNSLAPFLIDIGSRVRDFARKGVETVFTGHSRGGAHAQLASSYCISTGLSVHSVHVFGSPLVGNAQYAEWVKLLNLTHCYRNESDIVPLSPLLASWSVLLNPLEWPWIASTRYQLSGRLHWFDGFDWRSQMPLADRLLTRFRNRHSLVGEGFGDHSIRRYIDVLRGAAP